MSGGSTAAQPAPGSTDAQRAFANASDPAPTTTAEDATMIQHSKESITDSSLSPTQPLSSQTTVAPDLPTPPPIPDDTADAPAPRRGSKRSFISRSRNVSRSSRQSARGAKSVETKDAKEPVPLLPQQDGSKKQKKARSGFLSFLNCCSPSDSLESVKEEPAVPPKKAIIQPVPVKTERPSEQTEIAPLEKDARKADFDEKSIPGSSSDVEKAALAAHVSPPVPELVHEDPSHNSVPQTPRDQITTPDVNIIAPTPEIATEQASRGDSDPHDVQMTDVHGTEAAQLDEREIEAPAAAETQIQVPLPPPPPLNRRQEQLGTSEVPPLPEGSVEKQTWLLPPAQPHLQGRKCLILDLDETLVHSSFKILNQADFTIPVEIEGQYHNVYVIKRPGVDAFMKRVGELFEVVVFTASVSKYGDPLLDQLDIHHVVHHRLFRESCYNHQGNYVKDLSQVGRDLKETIIIDNSPTSYIFHPQHAVPISSWFSDAHDNELLDLIPVLEDLAGPQVPDVSLVLDVTL
ncbi:hypothetical protein DV738_g3937, partial [Chaetothyriales sp. CBS 135597]